MVTLHGSSNRWSRRDGYDDVITIRFLHYTKKALMFPSAPFLIHVSHIIFEHYLKRWVLYTHVDLAKPRLKSLLTLRVRPIHKITVAFNKDLHAL